MRLWCILGRSTTARAGPSTQLHGDTPGLPALARGIGDHQPEVPGPGADSGKIADTLGGTAVPEEACVVRRSEAASRVDRFDGRRGGPNRIAGVIDDRHTVNERR